MPQRRGNVVKQQRQRGVERHAMRIYMISDKRYLERHMTRGLDREKCAWETDGEVNRGKEIGENNAMVCRYNSGVEILRHAAHRRQLSRRVITCHSSYLNVIFLYNGRMRYGIVYA